jgi:hypothetical protein
VPVGAAVLVTVTGPVRQPQGAVTCNSVEDTWVTPANLTPPKSTVEVLLKPTPVIVTTVPAGPPDGLSPVIDRVGVKLVELVPVPARVVTAILPAAAPFGTTAFSWVPDTNVTNGETNGPNFTVAEGTKSVPLIVTVVRPVIPEAGLNELTVGGLYM